MQASFQLIRVLQDIYEINTVNRHSDFIDTERPSDVMDTFPLDKEINMRKKTIICVFIAFAIIGITVLVNKVFALDVQHVDFKIEVDGEEKIFEIPIVMIDDRTYLPLREIAGTLNICIEWIGDEQKIVITTEDRIGQIALIGSFSDDYLFDIYLDKKVKITSARQVSFRDETNKFEVDEAKEQIEISLTQEQFADLINCIDNFINEDFDQMEFKISDPSPNFNIITTRDETIKKLDGSFFVNVDENRNYIQIEAAHNLMLILNEISPILISFVRAPY